MISHPPVRPRAQRALAARDGRLGCKGNGDIHASTHLGAGKLRRHHADDGEGHALEREPLPDHVIGGAEAIHPEAVADDRDHAVRGRPRVVVGSQHAAPDRADAEDVEVASVDVRAVEGSRLASLGRVEALVRPRDGAIHKIAIEAADLFPDREGPRAVGQEHQLLWRAHRQGPEQQAAEDREQGRVGADAERQRADGDGSESRASPEAAHRGVHVLSQGLPGADHPHVASLLDRERDVSERAAAHVVRGVGRDAVALEGLLPQGAVRLDLLPKVSIEAIAMQQVTDARQECVHGVRGRGSGSPQGALARSDSGSHQSLMESRHRQPVRSSPINA